MQVVKPVYLVALFVVAVVDAIAVNMITKALRFSEDKRMLIFKIMEYLLITEAFVYAWFCPEAMIPAMLWLASKVFRSIIQAKV